MNNMEKNTNIAGFAVNNGVCYLYNNFLSVGVVNDYNVIIRLKKIKNDARLRKFPFIRALIFVVVAIKNAIYGYYLSQMVITKKEKAKIYQYLINITKISLLIITFVIGAILGQFLLVGIPNYLSLTFFDYFDYVVVKSFVFNIVNSTFTLFMLIILTFILSIVGKKFLAYQSAVNKSMNALKNRISLDVDNVQKQSSKYFFNPISIIYITIIISIYVLPLFYEKIIWLNLIYRIVLFAIILSTIYEIFVFLNQYDNKFVKVLQAPSFWVQSLFNKKTDDKCIMCAIVALKEVLMITDKEDIKIKHNLIFEWQKLREEFLANNINDESDVDWIFCEVLKCNRAELKTIKFISNVDLDKVQSYAKIRLQGEPLQRIFGHTNFYGFEFELNDDTLIPRFDTEILVEKVLKDIKNSSSQKILDLCTGSGCIAITIAKLTNCQVVGVDINENALNMARINADNLNAKVLFLKSNLFQSLRNQKFDIIVSNPPYIKTREIENLEVKNYDPHLALDGGADGLKFYKRIISQAPKHLNKGGKIYFEIGKGQYEDVKKLLLKDFDNISMRLDYQGIERVVSAKLKD